jgi:hypothetical protein
MKKLFIILSSFLILAAGCSSQPKAEVDNQKALESNGKVMTIQSQKTLEEFFPILSGNLKDYKVSIPENYIIYKVSDSLSRNTFLWGSSEDLKAITADPSAIDFSKAKNVVFRVRFSINVGVNEKGEIADSQNILTKESYEAQGVTKINFQKGSFNGISSAPAVSVSGTLNSKDIFLAYLFSPADNLIVLVNLQGGSSDQNKGIWDNFIKSWALTN